MRKKQSGDILKLSDGNFAIFRKNDPRRPGYIILEKRGRHFSNFLSMNSMERWITHQVSKLDRNIINLTLKYQIFFSVKKIQKQWHKSINDTKYLMCRRRLLREFRTLGTI